MNELANVNDRSMKVSEVAEALGFSRDTIYNSAKELFPELFSRGKTAYLDEAQVTAVKMNLRKNSEVAMQPKTSLEKALLIKQAMQFQQEIIEGLQEENADLKAKIEADEDKVRLYKTCMESNGWQSISDVAKKLNRPGLGPNNLHKFLLREKVLFRNSRGYNVPYQGYIDRGYFRVGQKPRPDSRIVDDFTLVSQGGFAFIERLANGAFPLLALA